MFAVLVAVPVAAVDEDDGLVLWEDNIGAAGELFILRSVHGEAEATAVQERSQQAFRLGVLPRDPGHDPAAFFFVEDIRHGETRVPRTGTFGKLGLRGESHAEQRSSRGFMGRGSWNLKLNTC